MAVQGLETRMNAPEAAEEESVPSLANGMRAPVRMQPLIAPMMDIRTTADRAVARRTHGAFGYGCSHALSCGNFDTVITFM
jgi:hypothetical protein